MAVNNIVVCILLINFRAKAGGSWNILPPPHHEKLRNSANYYHIAGSRRWVWPRQQYKLVRGKGGEMTQGGGTNITPLNIPPT